MALLLRHLRQSNVVPPPAAPDSDIDLICMDYQGFLLSERSMMPSCVEKYLKAARRFLSDRFPSVKIYLKKLRAKARTVGSRIKCSRDLGSTINITDLQLRDGWYAGGSGART